MVVIGVAFIVCALEKVILCCACNGMSIRVMVSSVHAIVVVVVVVVLLCFIVVLVLHLPFVCFISQVLGICCAVPVSD